MLCEHCGVEHLTMRVDIYLIEQWFMKVDHAGPIHKDAAVMILCRDCLKAALNWQPLAQAYSAELYKNHQQGYKVVFDRPHVGKVTEDFGWDLNAAVEAIRNQEYV